MSCWYLSAAVLKSLPLLLIVRHGVHIVLSLCLLRSVFGLDSVFISPIIIFRFHPRASNTGGSYYNWQMPTLPCVSISRHCHSTWSSTGHISLSGTTCNWRPDKIPWFCSKQDLFAWGVAKAPTGIIMAACGKNGFSSGRRVTGSILPGRGWRVEGMCASGLGQCQNTSSF